MYQHQAAESALSTHNPYAMPAAPVALPPPVHAIASTRPASRWLRLGARLVDQFLYLLCTVPLFAALAVGRDAAGVAFAIGIGLTFLAIAALLVVNLVGLDRRGQTLGKRLLGIRIARRDGAHPSFGRSFGLRAVVPGVIGAVPLIGPLFALLDVLWILGEERRCLHDLIADTLVVPA